jgi:hypothetical protein
MSGDFVFPKDNEVFWEHWEDAYKVEMDSPVSLSMKEDEWDDEDDLMEFEGYKAPIKTIMTPFGVLPLTEQSLASSHFKFWVGHTNFKVKKKHLLTISNCEGVESIDVLTPYRFRIAVGKLFKDNQVMSKVRRELLKETKNA